MADPYGPRSFRIGTKEYADSLNNRGHVNYVPPKTYTAPKSNNTNWTAPNPYVRSYPSSGLSRSSGGSNFGKVVLLLIGGFLALGYFGSHSSSDSSTSTSVRRAVETPRIPAERLSPPPAVPNVPEVGTLKPFLNSPTLLSYLQDMEQSFKLANTNASYFVSTAGFLVERVNQPDGERQAWFDVSALDLSRASFGDSNRVLRIPCVNGAQCVQSAVYSPGQPASHRTYAGQQFWVGNQSIGNRVLWALQMMQNYPASQR